MATIVTIATAIDGFHMITAIDEKVNKDQRDPCLTTSFTPVQFKVMVTPALPEPPISFSSKISSGLKSNFLPFAFQQFFFLFSSYYSLKICYKD